MVAQDPGSLELSGGLGSSRSSKGLRGSPKKDANKSQTGRWTHEEHMLFLQGLELHGREWKKISKMIKTRSLVQIRSHAQKYFQKLIQVKQTGLLKGDKLLMDGKRIVSNCVAKDKKKSGSSKARPSNASTSTSATTNTTAAASTSASAASSNSSTTTSSSSSSSSSSSAATQKPRQQPTTSSRSGNGPRAMTRSLARRATPTTTSGGSGSSRTAARSSMPAEQPVISNPKILIKSDASSGDSDVDSDTSLPTAAQLPMHASSLSLASTDKPSSPSGSSTNGLDDCGLWPGDYGMEMVGMDLLSSDDLEMLMQDMYEDADEGVEGLAVVEPDAVMKVEQQIPSEQIQAPEAQQIIALGQHPQPAVFFPIERIDSWLANNDNNSAGGSSNSSTTSVDSTDISISYGAACPPQATSTLPPEDSRMAAAWGGASCSSSSTQQSSASSLANPYFNFPAPAQLPLLQFAQHQGFPLAFAPSFPSPCESTVSTSTSVSCSSAPSPIFGPGPDHQFDALGAVQL